jgi:alkylated DNA repair dioxygenase AlkB
MVPRQTGAVEEDVEREVPVRINPDAVVDRIDLGDGSWVDVVREWVLAADELFAALRDGVDWHQGRMFRYERMVEERRLGAGWRPGTPLPHPALASVHQTLQRRYKVQFGGFSMIQYRDGRDGQGFHRDTDMKWLDDTRIAILSLGARRPWLLRPWAAKVDRRDRAADRGATHDLAPGSGDLLVMGGRCQADWQHSVPYLPGRLVAPRISLQWRWTSRRGQPFRGAPYGAALTYNR